MSLRSCRLDYLMLWQPLNHVLRDIKDKFVLVYLNDVIIYLLKEVQWSI